MGRSTEISWCHHSFNPWWGCQRWSPGCENCYAETMATRWGHKIWGPPSTTGRRFFGDAHWREPLGWDLAAAEAGERRRVFCASMADVFEDHPHLREPRQRLFELIDRTPNLDWLVLTKRPANFAFFLPTGWMTWPRPNLWLGVSAENQEYADKRIPILLEVPAVVRFVSAEPLIGPITLRDEWILPNFAADDRRYLRADGRGIDWLIVGGESGVHHRPFDLNWARSLRAQCAPVGVAFHLKQIGGRTHAAGGCELDGHEYKEFPEPRRELAHA
jgi:protein gp37